MTHRSAILLLFGIALLTARAAYAENASPGRAAFLKYCSACHGTNGTGDGVVAGLMQPKPANLTELAKSNGGTFPAKRVRDIIDGRSFVTAHGESAMPVWGQVFTEEKAATQSDAHVRGKVQLITDYIATIQAH
jgi:mono/diheme cytochrome c family protein